MSCYEEHQVGCFITDLNARETLGKKLEIARSSKEHSQTRRLYFHSLLTRLNRKVKFTVPCAPPRRDPSQHSYNQTRCALAWRQCVADRRTLRTELVSRRGM